MPPASNRLWRNPDRVEVGRPPETGEEHLRLAPCFCDRGRFVAQTLEGLACRIGVSAIAFAGRARGARQRQNGGLLTEIVVARVDERIRPARDVGCAPS